MAPAERFMLPLRTPEENHEHGVSGDALSAYERGELTSNEMVSLAQNIYEAAILPKLPPRYFLLLEHMRRNGLIYMVGRASH